MAQQYQVDIVTRVQGASAVAKLEAALKKVEASSKAVDNQAEGVATSLQKLKNAASQSALANSKAALALEKLRLASLKASGSTDKAALAFQKLRVATAQSAVNSAKAAAGVNSLGNSAQAAGSKAQASAGGIQAMGSAINGALIKITAIVTAVQTFSKALGAAFERQNAEQRLKNLTGSTEEYEAALLSAAAIRQKFGMTQTEATKALGDVYSRLSGVGYGLKEVTTIYQGFNAIARESGVSNEAASAAFLQLGQAMGSGVLQGDELRSILEQMPQLTQAIAQEMGIAASQVKQFGADGKITSEVIFAALQKASLGATDLNAKLTPAQQAFNNFNKAVQDLSVELGTALIPLLTRATVKLTDFLQKLKDIGDSGALKLVIEPLKLIDRIAGGIGDTTDRWAGIQRDANGAIIDGKNETEQLGAKADEAVKKFSSLPQPIQSAKAATEQLKEQTQQLAAAQREYQAALGGETGDIDRKLSVTQAVLAAEKQINDAKLQQAQADLQAASSQGEREAAAQRIYDLTISNAQLEYEATIAAAAAEQQKVEAALRAAEALQTQIQAEVALQRSKGIYNDEQQKALDLAQQQVTQADANLQAQNRITEAVQKGAAAQLNAKEKAALTALEADRIKQNTDGAVASANSLANAYGRAANEASRMAGAAQTAAAAGAGGGGGGADGNRQWTNAYKPIVTKKLNAEGEIVDKTQKEIEREENALRLSGWKGGILKVRDGGADTFAAAAFNASWFAAGLTAGDAARQARNVNKYGGMIGPKGSIVDQEYRAAFGYADGGYVTGPQQAIVGEGGEPEYIIPASKMDSAMQRYGSGMRGSSVIPDSANVSVNYNGSTVDMGGTSYINKGDVNGIVSQAVNQTLSTLAKSPRARLGAGLR